MERKKITFDSFIRGSIGCVLVVGILMLVERLSGVLLPFFIAWLIAYMVYPLVKFFQYKLRLKSRIVSIFCALFLITLVGVSLFYLLVPPMVSEIGRMNDLLVTYLTNGAGNNVPKNLSEFIHENIDLQALNRILSEENILAAIKDTVPRVWALLAESLNILFSILASFIILLYVIFILLDYEVIAEGSDGAKIHHMQPMNSRNIPAKTRYFLISCRFFNLFASLLIALSVELVKKLFHLTDSPVRKRVCRNKVRDFQKLYLDDLLPCVLPADVINGTENHIEIPDGEQARQHHDGHHSLFRTQPGAQAAQFSFGQIPCFCKNPFHTC